MINPRDEHGAFRRDGPANEPPIISRTRARRMFLKDDRHGARDPLLTLCEGQTPEPRWIKKVRAKLQLIWHESVDPYAVESEQFVVLCCRSAVGGPSRIKKYERIGE